MIAYLQGTIQKKLPKAVIINCNSVGYLVHISAPLLEKTQEKNEIEVYIHTKVREDDISLFGFETFDELEFFKLLLTVKGIGPKHGMEMLGSNPEKIKMAIISGNTLFLSKIPGIGKKTAERIIVELKNKISADETSLRHGEIKNDSHQEIEQEAIIALENLGYQKFEILRVFKKLPDNINSTEELITYFLQNV